MPKKYTYSDFWEMRGRQSIWFTRNISYRMGAVIALWASRLRISPNMVSLMSGAITIISSILAVQIGQDSWVSGVILIVGLQLGYAFDCADGPLARATGQHSSFGILMDKLVDLSSGMIFPCIVAYGAGHFYFDGHPVTVRVLITVLILRVVFIVMLWIKELIMSDADRMLDDTRNRDLWWRIKKTASLYVDESVFRFGLALAWSLSIFWEYFVIYNIGVLFLSLIYLASSKKEMDARDLAIREDSES